MALSITGQRLLLSVGALVLGLTACTGPSDAEGGAPAREQTSSPHNSDHVPKRARDDDWTTYHYTQNRRGYDASIPTASGQLSSAWTAALDGAVYAEPLVIGTTIIAVTENDTIYGLSFKGKVLWKQHVGDPVPRSELPCGNIDPLGITGTPSYSPDTGQVYFAAELDNPIRHELFAVDVSTGEVAWSHSVDPEGMNVATQQERSALAIAQGKVWVPFGGLFGDCGSYHGWVVGFPLSGKGKLVAYQQPSSNEAGIWAPSGPAVDADGHLYVAVGNGAAFQPPYDDSDSIVELDGTKKVDLFAPDNWAQENQQDLDLGSTGPMLFSALGEKWVLAAGKAGDVYLLRRGDLGGIGGYAATTPGCPSWSGFAAHAGVVYVPCRNGLTAYRITKGPSITSLWSNTDAGYGAAPVLGGGAVWAVYNGSLLEIDPSNGQTVARTSVGAAPHFATPTLHDNLALVGTNTGVSAVTIS
jgi:hypothetical protein